MLVFFFLLFWCYLFFSWGKTWKPCGTTCCCCCCCCCCCFFLKIFFLDSGFECIKADFTSYFKHETSPWPQICQVCWIMGIWGDSPQCQPPKKIAGLTKGVWTNHCPWLNHFLHTFFPHFQLMFNCWFGLMVWDSRVHPSKKALSFLGILGIQTAGPQPTKWHSLKLTAKAPENWCLEYDCFGGYV